MKEAERFCLLTLKYGSLTFREILEQLEKAETDHQKALSANLQLERYWQQRLKDKEVELAEAKRDIRLFAAQAYDADAERDKLQANYDDLKKTKKG